MSTGSSPFESDLTLRDGDDNRVSAVTVFKDRAFVTRSARAAVGEGLSRVSLEVPAFRVDSRSVAAAITGHGEIRGVQVRTTPVETAPQPDRREIEAELEGIESSLRPLHDGTEVIEKEEAFLDSIAAIYQEGLPRRLRKEMVDVAHLDGTLKFLAAGYERLRARRREIRADLDDLERRREVLKRRLGARGRHSERDAHTIELLFQSDREQEIGIEASYVAEGASWEAVYQVNAAADLSGLTLSMLAKVSQTTGERWDDVVLTVSNVVPSAGGELPEAESWLLRQRPRPTPMPAAAPPPSARAMRARGRALAEGDDSPDMAVFAEESLDDMDIAPDAEFAEATKEELPTAVEYGVPGTAGIASGGPEAVLPLFTREIDAEFSHRAVPRADPLVYLVARAASPEELIEGTLEIRFGNRYVGSTRLGEKRAGLPLLVNLGPDRGVKVRRERPKDRTRQKFLGLDRPKITREFEVRILAENLKQEAVSLEIFEAVPVSPTDVFQVKGIEVDPEPTERDHDSREGVMRWELPLKPGETREINTSFSLTYPRRDPPLM